MNSSAHVIGAIAEIFTWTGLGAGLLLGTLALVLKVADGSWLPARAVVEPDDAGHFVRWLDHEGEIGEAPLSEPEYASLHGADMADIYYRVGRRDRMRLHRGSTLVRALGWLAVGFAALGLISFTLQLILLFAEG
ncbi:MAG TPA: hypothetical protein VNT50_11060 [Microbacterium sp.]|uniref:hypothetical protein n=1 Tax=Microbacterium sp. TaxID=51671 RepID=UPI002B5BCA58|nr:hypothetical protein [Microbacterium sp.]HWI32023.1 hypothetical protein [Microbacterium sp.]